MDKEEKTMPENTEKTQRRKRFLALLKLGLLLVIVVMIPLYIYFFHRDLITRFENYEDVVNTLRSFGVYSVLVYILAQTLQIMISVLPGQVFQFAAGSVFGFLPGLLISIAGAAIGATVTYHLAKFLGEDAMHQIFGEERMQEYVKRLNSERAYLIVFLIYLIPGLPKDLVCYAAGMSDMKYRAFILLSTVGRIPGMCGSLLFGHMFMQKNYTGMIIVAIVAGIILLLCFLFRKRLRTWMDKVYVKISK